MAYSDDDFTADNSDDGSVEGPGTGVMVRPKRAPQKERPRQGIPRYNVLLWDSDDHTFEYVEQMLRELFGHTQTECRKIAETVDADGRAVVITTTKEHAELKRDQIHAYGKDHTEASKGSMWATIESVE